MQNKSEGIIGNGCSADHLTKGRIHTDITCNTEEPQQKYRLRNTALERLKPTFKGFGHMILAQNGPLVNINQTCFFMH